MGLGELLVGGVVDGASLLQRLFWLPNRNSHLAWAIFCDLEDRAVADPTSDSGIRWDAAGSAAFRDPCSSSAAPRRTPGHPLAPFHGNAVCNGEVRE